MEGNRFQRRMCDNIEYEQCMKCQQYNCDTTIMHRNSPTESIIQCRLGGTKKWTWVNTENGIQYEPQL